MPWRGLGRGSSGWEEFAGVEPRLAGGTGGVPARPELGGTRKMAGEDPWEVGKVVVCSVWEGWDQQGTGRRGFGMGVNRPLVARLGELGTSALQGRGALAIGLTANAGSHH